MAPRLSPLTELARVGKDAHAQGLGGAEQAAEVAQGVDLGLLREPQRRRVLQRGDAQARQPLDLVEAGAVRGLQFAPDHRFGLATAQEEIAVEPFEVAVQALAVDDALDAVDGALVAGSGQARPGRAVDPLDLEIAVVDGAAQVRRGAMGLARPRLAIVDHHHIAAVARQQVGGGEAGDAGADHHHVRPLILPQRRARRDPAAVFPGGGTRLRRRAGRGRLTLLAGGLAHDRTPSGVVRA